MSPTFLIPIQTKNSSKHGGVIFIEGVEADSSYQEEKQEDATVNLSSTRNQKLFSVFIFAYFDFGF